MHYESCTRYKLVKFICLLGIVPPKLKDLVYELKEVDWNQLGIQLNVPRHILRNIDRENPGNESRKLSEVLQYWIDNAEPAASWEKIVEALRRIGGHKNIITTIQSKYIICQSPHHIPQTTGYPIVSTSSMIPEEYVRDMIDKVLSLVDELVRFPIEIHDCPCADAHLIQFSKYIVLNYLEWEKLCSFLRLSEKELKEFVTPLIMVSDSPMGMLTAKQCTNILRRWRRKFGNDANYR